MAVAMKTTVTQSNLNVVNNTSKVTVKTTVTASGGSYNLNDPSGTYKIYKNSTSGSVLASGSFTHDIIADTTTTIFKDTFTLEHDTDGTLDIVVVVTFDTGISAGTLENTVPKELTAIARQSTVSALSCNIEDSTIITINRNSSSFRHTLKYGYSKSPSVFYTIVSKTKSTSYGWTVPEEAYTKCPEAKYVNITIRCYTYYGDDLIGYNDCYIKAYANKEACKPQVRLSLTYDSNEHCTNLTGDNTRLIKGISTLAYSVYSEPQNSAENASVSVTLGSRERTTYEGEFANAKLGDLKAVVTDTRGYSSSDTASLTVIDYNGLSINGSVKWIAFSDEDSKIHITLSGKYSDVDFGAVENSLTLKYKCINKSLYNADKTSLSNASYTTLPEDATITIEDGKFSVEFDIAQTTTGEALNYRDEYSFRFMAKDMVFSSSEDGDYKYKFVTKHIASALPIFDWGKNDFNFNVPVYHQGISWNDLTIASGFKCFNGLDSNQPQYKSIGSVVSVRGVLSPEADTESSNDSIEIASGIPEECCPSKNVRVVCQGSNTNRWLCTITTDGKVMLARYGTTGNTTIEAGAWLPFDITYLI